MGGVSTWVVVWVGGCVSEWVAGYVGVESENDCSWSMKVLWRSWVGGWVVGSWVSG